MNKFDEKYFKQYQNRIKINLRDCYGKLKKMSKADDFKHLIEASAVYSSNIEGNSMDLNSFMNIKAFQQKAKPKEFVEIMELVSAYNFAKDNKLSELNFLKAHKMLSKSFLGNGQQGKYRNNKVGVFNGRGLVYLAVEPELVKKEMKDFFKMIGALLKKELSIEEVFYFASMIHLKIAHIHPFADGNGRAARLVEKWFLAEKLNEKVWLIQSEKYYKEHLGVYYKNINLGVNYYELNYDQCLPFLLMLPRALLQVDARIR